MPNGGSDCCGTCWFNRSLRGKRGSVNFNRDIPSHREIRDLDIPDPFYTYCANHPYHRPSKDRIPIGPVYVHVSHEFEERKEWRPSPDTEEIRQHLLDIVRLPEERHDAGYHFYTHPAYIAAGRQLREWRDERLNSALQERGERQISALEEIAQRTEVEGVVADIQETIRLFREQLEI